jgi:O-antigen/teichoic acid export membrane protein
MQLDVPETGSPASDLVGLRTCPSPARSGLRWIAWLRRTALATVDQGMVSGANFVVNILLARWLTVAGYGAYAFAFYGVLFLIALHQALVLEPMSVLGAALDAGRRPTYVRTLIRMHAGAGLLVLPALAIAALVSSAFDSGRELVPALLGLMCAAPFLLLFWLLRGVSYLELEPRPSAIGAFSYAIVLLGGLSVLRVFGRVSPFSAFACTGAAGLLSSCVLWVLLRPATRATIETVSASSVWRGHWEYGRWPLLTAPLTVIRENLFFAVTGAHLGLQYVGALQGMFNLVLPLTQLANCLCRLFQPYLARIAAHEGNAAIRSGVARIAAVFGAIGLTYAIALWAFHSQLLHLLYRGRLDQVSDLTKWMGVTGFCYLAAYVPALGLRAIKAPSLVAAAYGIASAASAVAVRPLIWRFQLAGAVAGLCLSNVVCVAAAVWMLRKKTAD